MQEQDLLVGPVTALAFFTIPEGGSYLLAGEDTRVRVYDVESSRYRGSCTVFAAQPIHGLVAAPDGGDVLVWGARSVAVLGRDAVRALARGDEAAAARQAPVEASAADWVLDGAFCPGGARARRGARLALITAHNELVPARFDGGAAGRVELGAPASPSRPILYSARLVWEAAGEEEEEEDDDDDDDDDADADSVLVAAGTVFGEILVWRYRAGTPGGGAPACELLHVLAGHEGSVFGVDLSPRVELGPGRTARLLASCSDDRTVRVWDITGRRGETPGGSALCAERAGEARETGFVGMDVVGAEARGSARSVAMAMGHASRIWHVRFAVDDAPAEAGTRVGVYSFGEDATTQKWELALSSPHSTSDEHVPSEYVDDITSASQSALVGKLKHVKTTPCHTGKHIWAAALSSQKSPLIATGGSDGKINLLDASPRNDLEIAVRDNTANLFAEPASFNLLLSDVLASAAEVCIFGLDDTDQGTSDPAAVDISSPNAKESAIQYTFISETQILVATSLGRLLIGTLGEEVTWKRLRLPQSVHDDLSWSVVRSNGTGRAILGSSSGNIYWFREPNMFQHVAKVQGKVADVFWLSQSDDPSTPDGVDGGKGSVPVDILVTTLGGSRAVMLQFKPETSGSGFVQSVIELDKKHVITSAAIFNQMLVIGCRNGDMLLYDTPSGGEFRQKGDILHRSKDAITSITPLPGQPSGPGASFLTTCRDGNYRIYHVSHAPGGEMVAQLQHETAPPFGPLLEGASFVRTEENGVELVLYGFRSRYFVAWNETTRQEMAAVDCGGGHRRFAFCSLASRPDSLFFIYSKAKMMHIYAQGRACCRTLRHGNHGREMRAVSFSGRYVATGAEDTLVKIWGYEPNADPRRRVRCLAVMDRHGAGIQCLKWHGEDYLFSSGGSEEFFVWRISRVESEYRGLAVVCEAAYPDKSIDGDLRIMSFDLGPLQGEESTNAICISLAFSNSTLRTYRYHRNTGFQLLAEGRYTGACLTQIRHLHASRGIFRVLTASTDGHLAVWSASSSEDMQNKCLDYSLVQTAKVHQSSVKSLDLKEAVGASPRRILVVSGGDDNALGLSVVEDRPESRNVQITERSIIRSAHAAAINAVSITDVNTASARVVSTGNDQRVKTWRVCTGEPSGLRVELLANKYSSVADAGDVDVMGRDRQIMIVGVGMEIWTSEVDGAPSGATGSSDGL